jgi:hypothetical protein
MAIVWANGVISGYLAEGADEDDARSEALKMVFKDSADKGIGFTIISPADVPYLPERNRDSLNATWEHQARMLDQSWP